MSDDSSPLAHSTLYTAADSCLVTKMARPVGGIREKPLIITLPGYPKGAMENLEGVMKFFPHAFLQDSRSSHTSGMNRVQNEAGATISHHLPRPQTQHYREQSHGPCSPKKHTSLPDKSQSNLKGVAEGAEQRCHNHARPMASVEEALRIIGEQSSPSIVVDAPCDHFHYRLSYCRRRLRRQDGTSIPFQRHR